MRAITPEKEDPETGRWSWTVTTETNDDHETTTETYDAVMICTGHHSMPNIPDFEGAADFAGDMLHSHEYKDNARFAGKKVVTVGIGNSSSDITTEISKVAESTHCVCRSGAWIQLNGHGDAENLAAGEQIWGDGKPFVMSRMEILRQGWSGEPSSSLEIQDGLAANQEWVDELGLKPIMRVGQAHPTQTLNNPENNLLKQLKEGKITIKRGLERITEHGVVFTGSDEEVPADSIVFCTGWIFGFEFVDKVVWPEKCGPADEWQKDNENTLYKFMCEFQAWPLRLSPGPLHTCTVLNPLRSASSDPTTAYNNIAWCGLCQPLHSQFLVSEIQSRHAIATFMGRLELPPLSRQLADIQEKREHMRVQFKDSPRHTMMVSVSVLDELGEDLGVTPTLGRLLRTGSFEKLRAAVKW